MHLLHSVSTDSYLKFKFNLNVNVEISDVTRRVSFLCEYVCWHVTCNEPHIIIMGSAVFFELRV